ncbi:MAG: ferrous iron transport protein A [Actinomycetales bacterium]|nr:ferrous iron transport protein A [Actinomycetales bacterium]
MPLIDWPLGEPAVLAAAGPALTGSISRLGLRAGMSLTPMMRTPGRGLVVAAGELRLALDRATAAHVQVHAARRSPGPEAAVQTAGHAGER